MLENRSIVSFIASLIAGLLINSSGLALAAPTNPPTNPPTTAPTTTTTSAASQTISWDQAAKHVGETATVTGPVIGTHALSGGKRVVLNVGKDFPDATRFTVFLTLGESGPGSSSVATAPTTTPASTAPSVDQTYVGKTISVTGTIELYHDVAEIRAKADDIVIQE